MRENVSESSSRAKPLGAPSAGAALHDAIISLEDAPASVAGFRYSGPMDRLESSEPHHHRKGQLLYTISGIVNCEVDDGIWILPSGNAVWIPSGVPHRIFGAGAVECVTLFIDDAAFHGLPAQCCNIPVSELLSMLILRATDLPIVYAADSREARLVGVLFDELAAAPIESWRVPMPSDTRLRRLAEAFLANPSRPGSLSQCARRISMSESSLNRLLFTQTGLTFGRWRRQLQVITALHRLQAGDNVETVALYLGYKNASSFVTMFKKMVGKPPMRWLVSRDGRQSCDGAPCRGH